LDNVQIEIQDSDNSILGVLEVGNVKNFPLSLTSSISDLRDITKRSGSYSTPFKAPSTKANDDLLEHIYLAEQKNYKDFDAVKDCVIRVNGIDIEKGQLQITKINSLGRASAVNYSFKFFGNNMDWVIKMKGYTTSDLPYLDKTLTYDDTSVQASWSNVGGTEDEVYSIINRGARIDPNTINVGDLRPDYFLLDYLESAFNLVGYNFESTFFNTSASKQLMIPFFGKNWIFTEDTINDNLVNVEMSGDLNYNVDKTITNLPNGNVFDIDTQLISRCDTVANINPANTNIGYQCTASTVIGTYNENTDPANNFASGTFTAPKSGYYKVHGYFDYSIYYDHTQTEEINGNFTRQVSYYSSSTSGIDFLNQLSSAVTYTVLSGTETRKREAGSYEGNGVYLTTGQSLRINQQYRLHNNTSVISATTPAKMTTHGTTWYEIELLPDFEEGETFNWSEKSDDKIEVFDIIMDIFKLFNCYIRTNQANRTVYVEPRDDFYNALSTATNWTDKIDDNIQVGLEYNSKTYKESHSFNYTKDSNDKYLSERNKVASVDWCSNEHLFPSKFKDGTVKYNTKEIAATYTLLDDYHNGAFVQGGAYEFYTARLWQDADIYPAHTDDFAPRLLYFKYGTQEDNFTTKHIDYRSNTITNLPYALPFSVPSTIASYAPNIADVDGNLSFSDVTDVSDAGLWSTHFSKTSQEIEDGKRLTVNLLFDLVDYTDFDFRRIIYFDNRYPELEGYWRVEKVKGFKPTGTAISTTFELTQARTFPTAGSRQVVTGGDSESGRYGSRLIGGGLNRTETTSNNRETIINGYDNEVMDNGNAVYGNNLRATGQNQLMYGMYNTDVSSDVSTDLLNFGVGTKESPQSLIRVDQYGTVYFNGSVLPSQDGAGLVVPIASDTTADTNVLTYLVDTSSNDVTVTLPSTVSKGKTWNIKKMSDAYTLTIETESSETIDEATDKEIKYKYNSFEFQFDGTNYVVI